MALLLLAIETTDLMKADLPADHASQPHLVEVACELMDDDAASRLPRRRFCETVRAEGWHVTPKAAAKHGLSSRRVAREGLPELLALWTIKSKADEADAVIAYQGEFTRKVIASLLGRQKHSHRDDWIASWSRPRLQFFDLGLSSTPLCKLPGSDGTGAFRRPKLEEAFAALCGGVVTGPLDAGSKLDMTLAIYHALRARNVLEAA